MKEVVPHVLWLATYEKRKAYITLKQSLQGRIPGWIHEYGDKVNGKFSKVRSIYEAAR